MYEIFTGFVLIFSDCRKFKLSVFACITACSYDNESEPSSTCKRNCKKASVLNLLFNY